MGDNKYLILYLEGARDNKYLMRDNKYLMIPYVFKLF